MSYEWLLLMGGEGWVVIDEGSVMIDKWLVRVIDDE